MTDSPTSPKPGSILAVVSSGVFMCTMDSSMINVALPFIMKDFHSPFALTEWVVLTYLMTITILLLIWGNLADRWSRTRFYSLGMLIFTGGSLLCAAAPSIYGLIFFRLIQALGASMMMAVGPALIKFAFPTGKLGRGLGMVGVATSLGLMSGPFISGQILRWTHWRAIFFFTVPLGLFFYFYGKKHLASLRRRQVIAQKPANASQQHHPFDTKGALLWGSTVISALFTATHATTLIHSIHNTTQQRFVLLAGGLTMAISSALLIAREKSHPSPLIPVGLLKRRFFSMAVLSAMLSFTVLFSVLIIMPFFLSRILELSSDKIGYVMMALPATVFCASPLAGKIHDHTGEYLVAACGLFCCLVSILLLSRVSIQTTIPSLAWYLALLGFGQAMFLSPNSAATLSGVPNQKAAIASGTLATARNLGMLLGTAITGLLFTHYFSRLTGGLDMRDASPAHTEAFIVAMRHTLRGIALFAGLALLASALRGRRSR